MIESIKYKQEMHRQPLFSRVINLGLVLACILCAIYMFKRCMQWVVALVPVDLCFSNSFLNVIPSVNTNLVNPNKLVSGITQMPQRPVSIFPCSLKK